MTHYSAITGIGIYTPIGRNVNDFRSALLNGADGISLVKRFSTEEFTAKYAAMIEPEEWRELGEMYPDLDQRITMALLTAQEAIQTSSIHQLPPERVGLVLGICLGKLSKDDGFEKTDSNWQNASPLLVGKLQYQVNQLARHLKIKGPAIAISTACASSNHAIGYAQDLLRFGFLDAVVVGGTSEVTPHMFAGFYGLNNMSDSPCAPYSLPIGLNLGEGAGCLVIEKKSADTFSRGKYLGSISGFGAGSDAYHPTTPDPKGRGVSRAIRSAISDLGVDQEDVGYINTHGTGTHENDLSEWLGIKEVFGSAIQNIPISSNKSFIGHTGGAAGMIETIISIVAMNSSFVPTMPHFTRARRLVPSRLVSTPRPLPHKYNVSLNCNSGFGGSNAAVVLSKESNKGWKPSIIRGISILGVGSVSTYGLNNLSDVFSGKSPVLSKAPPNNDGFKVPDEAAFIQDLDLTDYTGKRDERFLDPLTNYMVSASVLALDDSKINEYDSLQNTVGIITGVSHIPSKSLLEFRNSITERGVTGISPHAFSKVVMNASMGAICETLEIEGPSNTIAAAEGAGLLSIIQACVTLNKDPDTNFMYATAGDELGDIPLAMHQLLDRAYFPTEGAGCILLGKNEQETEDVRITGAGIAGPDDLNIAIHQALGEKSPSDIPLVLLTDDGGVSENDPQYQILSDIWGSSYKELTQFNPANIMGYADASTSMFAVILAVEALREGYLRVGPGGKRIELSKILIIHSNPINASCALLLEK